MILFCNYILFFRKSVEIKYKSVLSVYGDRGCGKSTLIANWIKKFKSDNPEIKVIHQYTGACAKNTDIAYFLRRCIQELRYEFFRQGIHCDNDYIQLN